VLVLVFLRREANLSELQADFVSKVSHEFRTPLTSIRMFAETMQRTRGDQVTQDKCIDGLGRETERLVQVIERLLDWGRMEAGRKLFELHPQTAGNLVAHAVEAFAPVRDRTPDLDFAVHVDPDLPPFRADLGAMADAIGNLLNNALKYGGTPPVVRLRVCRVRQGVGIEVSDNGVGIPPIEHRRIFWKFYRIDDRLSREREGSGLGLAIVKHIVRAHRGRVQVESARGRGTTFRIVLPVAAPGAAAKVAAVTAGAKGS
jgi:two-component system, OmpR family, phosphate regulon sensor histidine kinase PhoR